MNKPTRKIILCSMLSVFLFTAPAWSQNNQQVIEISVKHPEDTREITTKNQLQRLMKQHNVSKWIFSKKILIDRDVQPPHSHPVLTLNTAYIKDDELLFSTFVHEQLHWFFEERNEQTKKAVAELRTIFPEVPVGFPEGAQNEESSYLHLLVCYLEYRANREAFGELKARQVIEFWVTHHYTWIYKQVLNEERKIAAVVRKHKLTI